MSPVRAVLLLALSGALLVGVALPGGCGPGGGAPPSGAALPSAGPSPPGSSGEAPAAPLVASAVPPAGSLPAASGPGVPAPVSASSAVQERGVIAPSAVGSGTVASARPGGGAPLVIAALGDSLTDPKSHGGGYLEIVRERCPGSTVVNLGKGGNMVNQMRRRFVRDVLEVPRGERPAFTHLIVFGGVNDVLSNLTAKRTPRLVVADLSAIYAGAREAGMTVIALTLSPWGGFQAWFDPARHQFTLELNDWIRGAHGRGEVSAVVDAWALLSCGVPTHLCAGWGHPFKDGLHFGPRAHQALGEALVRGPLRCE